MKTHTIPISPGAFHRTMTGMRRAAIITLPEPPTVADFIEFQLKCGFDEQIYEVPFLTARITDVHHMLDFESEPDEWFMVSFKLGMAL